MLMLDAMKGVKPKNKHKVGAIACGVLVLAGLGAGLPAVRSQGGGCQLAYAVVDGARIDAPSKIVMNVGGDAILFFSKPYQKYAVGSAEIAVVPQPKDKDPRDQILINGASIGRTTLTYWCGTDELTQIPVIVTPDLTTLRDALRQIDASINVEMASDREAVVLKGSVPSEVLRAAAEARAKQYMEAGGSKSKSSQKLSTTAGQSVVVVNTGAASGAKTDGSSTANAEVETSYQSGRVINMITVTNPSPTLEGRIKAELERMGAKSVQVRRLQQDLISNDREDVFVVEGQVDDVQLLAQASELALRVLPGSADDNKSAQQHEKRRIINRMTSAGQVASIEAVIQDAVRAIGCPRVTVRKVASAVYPTDADILVLEGTVPTQAHLARALTLASRIFEQQEVVRQRQEGRKETIRETDPSGQTRTYEKEPKLDESSSEIKVIADESGALRKSGNRAFGGSSNAVGSVLGASGGSSGASNNIQRLLDNQIDSNIARAKALEMADGRVLSFLRVEDIPEVRVDIKLYEINRTALLTWNSQQSGGVTDYKTGSTLRDPSFVQNPVTGEFQPDPTATPVSNPDVRNVLSFLGGGISNRLQISGNHVQIDSLLSLLEKEGIARSLSSPQLTVLSGELAFFGVGGTVPVQNSVVTQFGTGSGGNNQAGGVGGILNQTVERDFGIRLSVRPLVEEDGMITLDVIPSVSQPDSDLTRQIRESTGQSLATTAFQERSLRTSARLRDGGTLLIGGLTSRARTDNTNQTPFLHKIPIIGNLFKGYSYGDDDRELVIVVNPVIVREAPKEAPMWAFPDTEELMQSVQQKALRPKQNAEKK